MAFKDNKLGFIDIKRISKKRKVLKYAEKELKKHFVGIDSQIERVIRSIETWYCCPELLTKPVIICLFGPTGVGKSDLVRRLVKLLGFRDRFCEIELINKGRTSRNYGYENSISSVLSQNPKIESGEPSILLLDEMQNFRALDEDGRELAEYKFRDVWSLLSDGKLSCDVEITYLLEMLWNFDKKERKQKQKDKKIQAVTKQLSMKLQKFSNDITGDDIHDDGDTNGDTNDDIYDNNPETCGHLINPVPKNKDESDDSAGSIEPSSSVLKSLQEGAEEAGMGSHEDTEFDDTFELSYYSLSHFRKSLKLQESIQEIATWSIAKKKQKILDAMNDPSFYEDTDYTKTLIFVSGNIDEAYQLIASKTDDIDIDADIFHELSRKINVLDIKKALSKRFKPEQIARFGNNYVIYPSLSKKSYEIIIRRKIAEIEKNIYNNYGIKMDIDDTMLNFIYQNGVFPAQGTRPVFSTISEIIESPLPDFLLGILTKGNETAKMYYEHQKICIKSAGYILKRSYFGDVDKLREQKNRNVNKKTLASVHEAGHATIYAHLFKLAPPQLTASPAAQNVGGFIGTHTDCGSKQLLEDKICSVLAGTIAEKIVFGEENATYGGHDDLREATRQAALMIRRYSMNSINSCVGSESKSDVVNTDMTGTSKIVEEVIARLTERTKDLITKNKDLLIGIANHLINHNTILPSDFKKLCGEHGLKINIRKIEDVICPDYITKYSRYQKKCQKTK